MLDYIRISARNINADAGARDEQETLMAARALEEIGDRLLLVAADQKGSKPLEKLLRASPPEAFALAFKPLMEAAADLGPNQYGSHVLETALASWAERLGLEEASRPPSEPLVALCASLKEDQAWPALICDPCASHMVRSLLLALGGYAPEADGKGKAAARAGLLPQKRHDVPKDVAEARRTTAAVFVKLMREDESLCMSAHASPVVQLLLRILRDRGDRALVAEACAAVVLATGTSRPSVERCEALVASASGSRALEAVVEVCTSELFGELFASYFRPRLSRLVSGEASDFGPFLAQRVLDAVRDEPQLLLALKEIDFALCLGPEAKNAQHLCVLKVLEAGLRLNCALKPCAASVFNGLGLHEATEHHRVWPSLLALERIEASSLLRPAREKGRKEKEEEQGSQGSQGSQILRNLPAAGPQVMTALLRYPPEAVQALTAGLGPFLAASSSSTAPAGDSGSVAAKSLLLLLACERRTATVLEAALAPSSALPPKLRLRLARAFRGQLAALGPHAVGGWVCAAVWRCSLGDIQMRKDFLAELLEAEEALRANNFAVWKVCGLNEAKTKSDEWAGKQKKAGKAKRLFDELIEGSGAAAAEAAAEAKRRAESEKLDREALQEQQAKTKVLSDPLLAGLLADGAEEAPEAPAKEKKDKKRRGGEEAWPAEDELEAGWEIDALFKGGRRGQAREATSASMCQAASPASPADTDLKQALELIAGRAPAKVRKRQRLAEAKEAAKNGDEPPEKKKRKTGKRPGFTY